MKKYFRLFEALKKIYGSKFVSNLFGKRTNVIKLPPKEAKRFVKKELNIAEAGDKAVELGKKDLAELVLDVKQIEKLNDQELLTLTNNAERMAQRTNPKAFESAPKAPADIIDMKTQETVPPEGIASLIETSGQKTPPGTLMGNLESRIKQLEASGEDLSKMKGQTLDDIMKNEGQAQKGMAQSQKEGLVRATANDIMIADIKSGKFSATKEMQQEILEGSPKGLDYFRRFYGEDALEVLDSLGPDLAKMRSSREAAEFAKKQYNFEAKMDRAPGSIDLDDAKKAEDEFGLGSLKDDIDDPEEFAVGGRVGFKFGTPKKIYNFLKKLKKQNPKKQLTDDEIQDLLDELNQGSDALEAYSFDGTVGDAQKILKENKAYEAQMFTDYKAGRLDPKPGEKNRKEFLEKKLEEMEMSGDRRLMTPDEIEELEQLSKSKVYGKYKFTGKESMNDLYELERLGKITRDDMNVYDPRYKEYLDAQIINEEKLYTRKEWEKTPETIKNKTRGRIDPDWKEANFGEDYDFDQVRGKELEGENIDISNPETLDDFANFAKKNDPEGYKKIEDMVNDMNQKRELDNFDVTGRKKNSQGGLNYLLGF